MSDSIVQAVSSHPLMVAGEAAVMQADKSVWEQRSSFFPTLGVSAEGGRLANNDDTTRASTADSGGASSWIGQGTVTLTQPVFAGFGIVNRVLSAKDKYSAAVYDMDSQAGDIALRAARAHLNLMRTKELLGLASGLLTTVESRYRKISMMVKGGAASESELLQANDVVASVKNTRLGYEEAFRGAEADYREAVGGVPDTVLEIGDPSWNAMMPATVDDAVSTAVGGNSRVLSAEKMASSMAKDTSVVQSELLPHLDATVSYMKKDQQDVVGGEGTSAQAMLRLGWNFSLGGAQFARVGKSRQQEKEAAARRRDLVRNVERDVRQKYATMIVTDQQFALLSSKEDDTKKLFDNYVSQYEGGKQSNVQLLVANAKVFESQAARTDAYYRRLLARLELLNAMGKLGDTFKAPPPAANVGGENKKG